MPNAGEIMILRQWQVPALKRANMNIAWAQRKGLLDPAKPELNLATGDQT